MKQDQRLRCPFCNMSSFECTGCGKIDLMHVHPEQCCSDSASLCTRCGAEFNFHTNEARKGSEIKKLKKL